MIKQIVAIFILIVSVSGVFSYVIPQYNEMQALKEKQVLMEEALQKSLRVQENIDRVAQEINGVSDDHREALALMLPEEVDNLKVANDITALAQEQNLEVKDIAVQASDQESARRPSSQGSENGDVQTPAEGLTRTEVSFSVTAPYEEFITFLAALERSLQIFDFTSINLQSSQDSDAYQYEVNFVTYAIGGGEDNATPQ